MPDGDAEPPGMGAHQVSRILAIQRGLGSG
jgi:hypothetical protein